MVEAPFRDHDRRATLLDELENVKIVRGERRVGGAFVEVTHEFLIGSIRQQIQQRLDRRVEYRRLRDAEQRLDEHDPARFRPRSRTRPKMA